MTATGTQEQSNVVWGGVRDYVWLPWGAGLPSSLHEIEFDLLEHGHRFEHC